MKNTQGKWESHGRKVIVEGRWDDYTICECKCKLPSSHGVCYEKEEAKANAKLIASAPDLLNACKHLVSILGDENEDFYNKHIEAFNVGIKAITKAEDINHG